MPVPFPEGVASEDGACGFVGLRTGGILAIELESGHDLWTTEIDARPRLVVHDLLIVEDRARSRENVLQCVSLKIEDHGRVDREFDRLVLPDWVAVNDPERTFDYHAWAEGAELVIEWHAESFYAGGAAPSAQIEADARRQGHGHARFNLHSGQVVKTDDGREGSRTTQPPSAASARKPSPTDAAAIAKLMPREGHEPCVVKARLFYLLGAAKGLELVCVDVRTGERKWTKSLPDRRTTPPARRM
jgi:hypothetical protein